MTDQILVKILEDSFTIHELRLRIRILKSYLSKKFFNIDNSDFGEEINSQINWLYSLGDQFYLSFNEANFSQIFQELEVKIQNLPLVVIYFAIELDQQQLHLIGSWLRNNYGPQFIFEPKYDPSLIGGCALVWGGIYKDFSLRARISEKHDAILETIKLSLDHP